MEELGNDIQKLPDQRLPDNMQQKKDRTTKILIALVSVMIVAIAVMGYMLYDMKKINNQMQVRNQEVTVEKEQLKRELTDLLDDYDDLRTSNDSLNSQINKDKEHIQDLIKEIDGLKSYNYSIQKKYENELASLRNIMRSYVYQIDSLDQLNKALIAENLQVKQAHTRIKDEMNLVVERNDELELVLEEASVIRSSSIRINFLTKRNKETDRMKKAERIQTSFSLISNEFAEAGPKRVYLRIVRPDDFTMTDGNTFEYRERNIAYTAYRDVVYENKNLDVVIYYDLKESLITGKYAVEIYMEGNLIGETSFTVEK